MEFSEKQRSLILHSDAFQNVAHGPVRSGKTHGNLYKLCDVAIKGPPGDFALIGKTERTAKRNIIYPLMDLVPGAVEYREGAGELHLFGRRCYVIGANDAKSESKVRGMTLAGAYVNEWTLIPEEVHDQLIDRCSVDGARMFGDTNPDSPFHWLKKKHIDRLTAPDLKHWAFKLADNPVLSDEYKKRLYRIHTGLWLKRMVEGAWVAAEGAIYDMLDVTPGGPHVATGPPPVFDKVLEGVDYGTATVTVFLAMGRVKGTDEWLVFSEHYHDAQESGRQKTDGEHSRDFRRWNEGLGIVPASVDVDPSAAGFKRQLKDDGVKGVKDADNAVVDGIRVVSGALTNSKLKIHDSCGRLLEEMSNYSWNPVAQAKGEDKPIKKNDHGPDVLRYLCMRAFQDRPNLAVVYAF